MRRTLAASALLLMIGAANATPVTYDFSGTIDTSKITGIPGLVVFPAGLDPNPVGHTLSGSVTFETDTPDLTPANPDRGNYYYAVLQFSVLLDGVSFTYDPLMTPFPQLGAVYVYQNSSTTPPIHDFIAVDAPVAATELLDPLNEASELLLLHLTYDLDEITSDLMPPDLTAYSDWVFYLTISAPLQEDGSVNYVQLSAPVALARRSGVSVAEPASFALMTLGLAAIGFRRRGARGAAGRAPGA
jgi:hypothetical protein